MEFLTLRLANLFLLKYFDVAQIVREYVDRRIDLNPKIKITFTALFLITFSLFNAGLPVVISFCPMMMERDIPCCSSGSTEGAGLAVTTQTGDCCASSILAERNTTPFVAVATFLPSNLVEVAFAPVLPDSPTSLYAQYSISGNLSPPLEQASNPLFILHSALLI